MIQEQDIIIEQQKGEYKSFEIKNDPVWKDYPLSGVTYPTKYGYLKGFKSEDGHELDIFVGSGKLCGYIKVWRCDVPIETKIVYNVTKIEYEKIIATFKPVIKEKETLDTKRFKIFIEQYKK
ncbi:hypothetical protein FJZ22_03315 [Candidatus Pacearchaeota archaeon]|nr:hypothetical protein [Candidatus Pacearchaeota archaeon]